MRVVHLNPFFFPYAGGIERRILETGRRMAKRHDVHVVTSQLQGTKREETMDGVHVHRLPSAFRFGKRWNPPLVKTPGVLAALKELRPDVIDFHYRWSPSYNRAFIRSRRFSPRVFTYHNTYGEGTGLLGWASRLNDRWTRGFIRKADRIVAISDFIRDDLIHRRFPADRIDVVRNGVDGRALRALAAKGTVPKPLQGRVFVTAVGRLVAPKGMDLAIQAMPHLPPNLHLGICGEGPERASLERLARRLDVSHRVHLLGWVEEPDKLRAVQESVAFVHSPRFESFGLAPLEALAVGTPVVATRLGGLPEVVGSGGRLVPRDDPVALASATKEFLNTQKRRGASAAAKMQAETLDWTTATKALEGSYRRAQTT